MTRHPDPPNVVGVAFWVGGSIFVGMVVLLWKHPELFGWVLAVYAVLGLLGALLVAVEARQEAAGLRNQLRAEREAHEAESADVVRAPVLRIVEQRQGEHDHLKADDDWFARLYDDKGELR